MSNQYVKLSKVSAVDNPHYETPSKDDWKLGEDNPGMTVPVDYYVTGFLTQDVEVGKSINIARDSRNGVSIYGTLTTSEVKRIETKDDGIIIYTRNSIYHLDWLTPE